MVSVFLLSTLSFHIVLGRRILLCPFTEPKRTASGSLSLYCMSIQQKYYSFVHNNIKTTQFAELRKFQVNVTVTHIKANFEVNKIFLI